MRRCIEMGAAVWAGVALAIGAASLSSVNRDARLLVLSVCIVAAAAAVLASLTLHRHHERLAGALLVVSAAAPTFMAYALNVVALVVGLLLLAIPAKMVPSRI